MDDDAITMNGSAKHVEDSLFSPPPPKNRRKSSNFLLSSTQTILRLILWYLVFIVAFRCPSTVQNLQDDSPSICGPYLQVRSHVSPYIQPSYDKYIQPYVQKAQPLVDGINERVYAPAAGFVTKHYDIYAASHVDKVHAQFTEQWAASVEPQLAFGKQWARNQYEASLSPHLSKAAEIADPHVKHAQGQLWEIYDTTLVPLYEKSLPYVQQIYTRGHHITTKIIAPTVQQAQKMTSVFFTRRIWPRLVILYGENVEPQVMRITERLGRYKDSKKLTLSVVEMEAESSITSAASRASSAASSESTNVVAESTEQSESEIREKIESDLKNWQGKFAKAADKGAEDLNERVQEITAKQIKFQAHGVGKALVTELDTTVESTFQDLKDHINTSIAEIPDDASIDDEDYVYGELLARIKTVGEKIRTKAVAVRAWKQRYDNETLTLVTAALDSTLDVIDNIRDLGLQEIGMRWAWMEGVTYKDWSKYTAMKKTFDTWRDEVEAVALKHQGLEQAKEEGNIVQDGAMEVAKTAAQELLRLKDVAKWKVVAHDSSDDFESRAIPKRTSRPASTQAADEPAESVKTTHVWGGAMAQEFAAQAPIEDDSFAWADQIEGLLDSAGDKVAYLTNAISEAMLKPTSTQGHMEVVTSLAGDQYARALSAASSALFGTPQPFTDSVASVASNKFADAVTAASYVIYGTPTPILESLVSQASAAADAAATRVQEAYASITAAASLRLADGLSAASAQYTQAKIAIGAQPPPLHQQYLAEAQRRYYEGIGLAHDQYTRYVSAGSSAVYGAPTPLWQEYASAASERILGTPTPYHHSKLSELNEQYNSAFSLAKLNLDRLRTSVGSILKATPDPMAKVMLAKAEKSYSSASSKAAIMLAQASESASSAYYGSDPRVAESIASKVSEHVVGTETPWNEAVASQASASYSALLSKASEQIYGPPTPFVESAWSQAGDYAAKARDAAASQYKAVESLVSELVIGREPDFTESVMNRLSSAYYTGWASASSAASSVASVASEGVVGAAGSVSSVASEAYASASGGIADAKDAVESVASKLVNGEKDEL